MFLGKLLGASTFSIRYSACHACCRQRMVLLTVVLVAASRASLELWVYIFRNCDKALLQVSCFALLSRLDTDLTFSIDCRTRFECNS